MRDSLKRASVDVRLTTTNNGEVRVSTRNDSVRLGWIGAEDLGIERMLLIGENGLRWRSRLLAK